MSILVKLKKNFIFSFCMVATAITLFITYPPQANADIQSGSGGLAVQDVTADSLSVRTGPGTSYTRIATIYKGTDVVPTCKVWSDSGCSGLQPPYYTFLKVYYPVSSIGKYSSSAIGWVMQEDNSGAYSVHYLASSYGADVASSTGMPQYYATYCPDLGSPSSSTYPNGTYLPRYLYYSTLYAEECNPNAWGMNNPDTLNNWLRMGDGWKLNARS